MSFFLPAQLIVQGAEVIAMYLVDPDGQHGLDKAGNYEFLYVFSTHPIYSFPIVKMRYFVSASTMF